MPRKRERICAVVVTYNRKNLLLECLEALRKQTRPLDAIYIVDNASSDGTPHMLLEKGYINKLPPLEELNEPYEIEHKIPNLKNGRYIKIFYVRMPENTGSSGGFYEGMKRAWNRGYDWLWLMDDDVLPFSDCLSQLVNYKDLSNVLTCLRINKNNEVEEFNGVDLKLSPNPFSKYDLKIHIFDLFPSLKDLKEKLEFIEVKDFSFEGVFLNTRIIEKVGLPKRELFICGDDLEYSLRIRKYIPDLKFFCITGAIMERKLSKIEEVRKRKKKKVDWKTFYCFRNYTFIHRKYGRNFLVRVKPFFLFLMILLKNFKDFKKIKLFLEALVMGYTM